LNHVLRGTINPERPVVEPLDALKLLPLSEHSGHGRTSCRLDPGRE
jgi:hypothetical protein